VLIDANILLYCVDTSHPRQPRAAAFMQEALNSPIRVAFPWQSLTAFVRIATNPRASQSPLSGAQAWNYVDDWLNAYPAWIPPTSTDTARIFGDLLSTEEVTGNLVSDAALAAIAIEHGIPVVTNDTDFHRFPVQVINPFS
jgi:Predicted nucleic acid-binding protein, contains PIN domain